jgi:PrtD family type I secretion system ABC transporter
LNEYFTSKAILEGNTEAAKNQTQIDTVLRNAEVIQGMGMMPALLKRWYDANEKVLILQEKSSTISGIISSLSKFIRICLQVLILGVGAYLVIQNQLSSGSMIAASILLSKTLAPIEQSISSWKQFQTGRIAYQRLKKHFSYLIERSIGVQLPAPSGQISLKNVYYTPPGESKPSIQNLSFEITAGEALAIIGPSAAGKSTLARLILGALMPQAGSIRLDGAEVFSWDRQDIGKYLGYLPQDIELFSGTVKDNILRFNENSNDEMLIQAAKDAGIHEMILKLPHAYETDIGSGGQNLSGGQKQRIGLARAIYAYPKIVILDEPNSNLDSEGEIALIQAMNILKQKGSTLIVIAHRPMILSAVDRILVLNAGQIQFLGPRDEVLAKVLPQQKNNEHSYAK